MVTVFQQNVILFAIASAIILLLTGWIAYLNFRFNRLVKTAHKDNIETTLVEIYSYLEKNHKQNVDISNHLRMLDKKIHVAPRGLGLVMFKAFDGMKSGGTNSFSLALLNEKGDGAILSTLHSRERVNVYSKEIIGFKASVMLTEEEEQALTKAQNSLSL
ncbi:MAG: hypothetical protein RLZZ517_228 [Candidatus Parcubacteria bacterium]|jgi:hypothetical protein